MFALSHRRYIVSDIDQNGSERRMLALTPAR